MTIPFRMIDLNSLNELFAYIEVMIWQYFSTSPIFIHLLVKQLFSFGKGTTIMLINDKLICYFMLYYQFADSL